ncbi:MAG TPA: hypothetical protein VI413_00585 [Paludibacter sp.]
MKTNLKVVEPTKTTADELTAKLEAQLQEITHKKQLADNRAVFLSKKTSLQDFKKQIETEISSGNFEATKFKMSFTSGSYRDDEKFTISNTDLIQFFLCGLILKIDEEVSKIETELVG